MAAVLVAQPQQVVKRVHITGREIQALGTGRWHDVGGVPYQKKPTELHRFGDEATQGRDAFLYRSTGDQVSGTFFRQTAT